MLTNLMVRLTITNWCSVRFHVFISSFSTHNISYVYPDTIFDKSACDKRLSLPEYLMLSARCDPVIKMNWDVNQ